MTGFIKKDLAMIKNNFKFIALIMIIYTLMGIFEKTDISFILPFISVMLMITTFSYDNYNKWDAYSITLPNGRQNSVKSKYITTILITLIISFITIILSFLISYLNTKTINYAQILITIFGTIFGTLLVLTFMYPIIYKFGVEQARISIFLIIFGISLIGGILLKYLDLTFIFHSLSFLENYLIILLVITTIIMVYISYKISAKIFSQKEF